MFKTALLACALALAACLDVPSDEQLTEQEQDLDMVASPLPLACSMACAATTSTCTTSCVDDKGLQTTCAVFEGSCDQMLERKAREGRNPQTGETIQIPAKTTLKY